MYCCISFCEFFYLNSFSEFNQEDKIRGMNKSQTQFLNGILNTSEVAWMLELQWTSSTKWIKKCLGPTDDLNLAWETDDWGSCDNTVWFVDFV